MMQRLRPGNTRATFPQVFKRGTLCYCYCLVAAAFLIWTKHVTALTPDGISLLKLKAHLNDTKKFLSHWNESDANPCEWTGIICDHVSRRVIAVNLPYMHLGGTISSSIGELKKLRRLALHDNNLHGFIPPEIANCTELRAFWCTDVCCVGISGTTTWRVKFPQAWENSPIL